jgi:hypothetical protein
MTDRPWETEPDSLDFEAEGLPCAMRRGGRDCWCGYVGVGPEHPLFGLPVNHPLKLPPSWFEGRKFDQGLGPMDLFIHIMSGAKSIDDATPICVAFHVHGGCNWAAEHVPGSEPDGRWWFGFDCGHAGDIAPNTGNEAKFMREMVESMPEHVRETMRDIVFRQREGVYRDQPYVVAECQSLAAQLNAYAKLMETVNVSSDHRGN